MSANKYFILNNVKKIAANLSLRDSIDDNALSPFFSTMKMLDFKDFTAYDSTMLAESINIPLDKLNKTDYFKKQTSNIVGNIERDNNDFIESFHKATKDMDKNSFSRLLAEATMQHSMKNNPEETKKKTLKLH